MHTIKKSYELPDGECVISVGYYCDDTWKNLCHFTDENEAFRFCNYLNGGSGFPFEF